MQVEPYTTLALVYKITDTSLFSTTYYIRAVIRDSITGTTLASVNLSRSSDGSRYTGSTQTPADITGLGRHIDATISVYSDSGYTTYADGLPEILDKFYVHGFPTALGGSGGDYTDYDKIRKIVREICKEEKDAPVDLSYIQSCLDRIERAVGAIDIPTIPEQKDPDFSPVLSELQTLRSELSGKIGALPKPEKLDLTPALALIEESIRTIVQKSRELADSAAAHKEETKTTVTEELQKVSKELFGYLQSIRKIANIKEMFDKTKETMGPAEEPAPKPLATPLISKYFRV